MKEPTELGKLLVSIGKNHGDNQKQMSQKLNINNTYFSKLKYERSLSASLYLKLIETYYLEKHEKETLHSLMAKKKMPVKTNKEKCSSVLTPFHKTIFHFALRYAMPRQSYALSLVREELKKYIAAFSISEIELIIKESEECCRNHTLSSIDSEQHELLQSMCQKELNKRITKECGTDEK